MLYALLAEVVVALHFAFIAFVCLGALLALRWPRVLFAHAPALAWAVLIELLHWPCPLTPLENWLRRAAGDPGYEGGFMARYLLPVIYPAGLDAAGQVALGVALLLWNGALYLWVWRRHVRGGAGESPGAP
jgi:hypothetical protein